MINRKKVL